MASQDVIELDSSDEEPTPKQPTPKKAKPVPNAMVHIPNRMPGMTIKPSKAVGNKKTGLQVVKAVPVSLMKKNPFSHVTNRNVAVKTPQTLYRQPTPAQTGTSINPMSLIKNFSSSQLKIKKIGTMSTQVSPNLSIKRVPKAVNLMPANKPLNPATPMKRITPISNINKLPPGIVVKKSNMAISQPTIPIAKRKLPSNIRTAPPQPFKKMKVQPQSQVGDMLTVELDDDGGTQPSASPSWYLRPEEQAADEDKHMEEENNKEPEQSKMIEITIEDSPIKPPPTKRTKQVASETAITVEDSPVKPIPEKTKDNPGSGSEDEAQPRSGSPNSRKKLKYPKEAKTTTATEKTNERVMVEIEIAPMQVNKDTTTPPDPLALDSSSSTNVVVNGDEEHDVAVRGGSSSEDIIIEIPESPAKKRKLPTPKKPSPEKSTTIVIEDTEDTNLDSEFHPVYQSFIDMCFKLENSDDMRKIVEKKIKAYYKQVPKEYTESEEFVEMVSSKILAMKSGPEKMYLYIKDIVDELNLQRKIAKSEVVNAALKQQNETEKEAAAFYGDAVEKDAKKKRQVRKLEKTLKKLHRAINKLEEQEVDFDDDGDSVYILTERYKERLVRVHAKLCQLSNTKMPSEPRVHLEPRPGQPSGPARRLERWVNKRVPVGTPLPFPDFHDVLRCVRDANTEDNLGWNEADIMEEARDLFTRCGRKLQRRRQENEWRIAASRITGEAELEEDDQLRRKLDDNRKVAGQKEAELINKYADRQKTLQLEAVEIGDKEAEESPVESGDEAQDDAKDTTLEKTSERKERLMRLIKEKAKSNKGNQSDNNSQTEKTNVADNNSEVEEILPDKSADNNQNATTKTTAPLKDGETEMEVDGDEHANSGSKATEEAGNDESVQVSSDDSKKISSDIDELHLLQKLHSGTDRASSVESSDTDTPIAISDTLESGDDAEKKDGKDSSEVVSIENSSESESESNKNNDQLDEQNVDSDVEESPEVVVDPDVAAVAMNSDTDEPKKPKRNSNEEYTEAVENILLASSDEDSNQGKDEGSQQEKSNDLSKPSSSYVNLKDDTISIGDTQVEGVVGAVTSPVCHSPKSFSSLAEAESDQATPFSAQEADNLDNEPDNSKNEEGNLTEQCEVVSDNDKSDEGDNNTAENTVNDNVQGNDKSDKGDKYTAENTLNNGVQGKDKSDKGGSNTAEYTVNDIVQENDKSGKGDNNSTENTVNYVVQENDKSDKGDNSTAENTVNDVVQENDKSDKGDNNTAENTVTDVVQETDINRTPETENSVVLENHNSDVSHDNTNKEAPLKDTKDDSITSQNGRSDTENDELLNDINDILGVADNTSHTEELNSCSEKPLMEKDNVESV